jgi:hypothetical protein
MGKTGNATLCDGVWSGDGGGDDAGEPEADRGLGERQLARPESDDCSGIGGERRGGDATEWIGRKVLQVAPASHLWPSSTEGKKKGLWHGRFGGDRKTG